MKRFLYLLVFILIASVLFTRFWQLGILPPGMHGDEPSFAIEAQSLADTGKDTWGVSWPMYFKAYGEYKAPGLIYSYIPLIYLFGHVDTFVSRLPSAIAGILILVILFFTIKLLFPKVPKYILLILLAIISYSPWYFGTSRVYFETAGGLSFLAAGLFAILKYIENPKLYIWGIAAGAMLGISGYWYSSFRYIAILLILMASFLISKNWKSRLKNLIIISLSFAIIGFGWVQYTLSSQGLNRFNQFQGSLSQGQELVINEKRAFCYLSFDKDPIKAKICYVFWNKPLLQLTGFTTTYLKFLSPGFLFFDQNSEYGVDKDYGAFLWPMLLGYITGAYFLFRKIRVAKNDNQANQLLFILLFTLVGFLPAAIPQELSVHRSVVGLYGITIIIMYGLINLYLNISEQVRSIINTILFVGFIVLVSFITIQSQLNYFLVFTHSNDVAWGGDVTTIYKKLGELAPQYDHIIDTVYMGPLNAAFYDLIPVVDLQTSIRSNPNPQGWSYVEKSGKYEYSRKGLDVLICEKLNNKNLPNRTLLLTYPKEEYRSISTYTSTTWDKVGVLIEIYDLDKIIDFDKQRNIDWRKTCIK